MARLCLRLLEATCWLPGVNALCRVCLWGARPPLGPMSSGGIGVKLGSAVCSPWTRAWTVRTCAESCPTKPSAWWPPTRPLGPHPDGTWPEDGRHQHTSQGPAAGWMGRAGGRCGEMEAGWWRPAGRTHARPVPEGLPGSPQSLHFILRQQADPGGRDDVLGLGGPSGQGCRTRGWRQNPRTTTT